MKKKLLIMFYILMFAFIAYYRNSIASFLIENVIYSKDHTEFNANLYSNNNDYMYVSITDNFVVSNKVDILNTIYSILDSGMNSFSFYCAEDYEMCQYDVENISTDSESLSVLNNFVHPYNSYSKLYVSTNSMGKVKIEVNKLYNNEEINYINDQINLIYETIIEDRMTDVEKIKTFHDYVINNTVYDTQRAIQIENNDISENELMSHKANGVLINHIALCSGYTDLMAVFLNYIGVPNFKISTEDHIWNAVYINNNWLHLDLTWDDPVSDNGENVLLDEFFLISNDKLLNKKTEQHNYNLNIYKEIAITVK